MTPQEKQSIKARFFGMHIGCKAIAKQAQGQPEFLGNMVGCSFGGVMFENKIAAIGRCKLILRPLSGITDQEAIECARIYDPNLDWKLNKRNQYFVQVVDNESGELFTIWFPKDDSSIITLIDIDENSCSFNQFFCVDYLRSRNFCLPFMGLDPAQEGWAILEPPTVAK